MEDLYSLVDILGWRYMKEYLIIIYKSFGKVEYVAGNKEEVLLLTMTEDDVVYISIDELIEFYEATKDSSEMFDKYGYDIVVLPEEIIEKLLKDGFGDLSIKVYSTIHTFLYNTVFKYGACTRMQVKPEIWTRLFERIQ